MGKGSSHLVSRSRPWPGVPSAGVWLLLALASCIAVPGARGQQRSACGVGHNLPPLCRCTEVNNERTVDCSTKSLLDVPSGIPDGTTILILSDNSIEQIRSDDLSNLVNLRELYMVGNIIRTETLDVNAFQNLRNLELLDLNGNRISMTSVTPFLPLVKLRHLDVGDNMFSTIDSEFVTIFDRLENLFMASNQLICDCRLLWFKNWLLNKSTREGFTASGAQCYTPASVATQTVYSASFCIPVQRCHFCNQASSNAACNFAVQQCPGINPACQNEVRVNGGRYVISKQCQSLEACLVNAGHNGVECNSGTVNSVCRYCCQGDKCNAPESAILADYQFPFPDRVQTTPVTPTPEATSTPVLTTEPTVSTRRTATAVPGPTTPSSCPAEETRGDTGVYRWPETLPGGVATLPCAHNPEAGKAIRLCEGGQNGEGTGWGVPGTSECPTASSILEDLSNVTIGRDNALDVSETLTNVTSVSDVLRPDDVTNVVNTFENLVNAIGAYEEQSPDVLRNVLDAVNNLGNVPGEDLARSQLNDDSASRLLSSIDSFNLGVSFPNNVLEEDTPSIDVAVVDITDPADSGLFFFGSSRINGNSQPKIVTNASGNADDDIAESLDITAEPDVIVRGSIYMPNSLLRSVGTNLSRCQFVMYQESTFFDSILLANRNRTESNEQEEESGAPPTTGSEVTGDAVAPNTSAPSADCISFSCSPDFKTIVNSVVISGAVGNQIIENLEEPVTISFRKNIQDAENPRCVFWDVKSNDGWGGWSDKGCRLDNQTNKTDDVNVVCKCDHLTNFALLMDIYNGGEVIPEPDKKVLAVISYVGCSLSLIGLVLTLITYTCCGSRSRSNANEKKFSPDKRTKVLVNFVVSLILVNVFFLAGSLTAEHKDSVVPELCTAMAVCLHYSLLAAMAWMAVQAFNMYMALVKVFATYFSHFLLKMVFIGWGIPLIIVGITVGVDLDNYGDNSGLCWLGGTSFYVAFLLPVCLVLVFNTFVFVAVTWKLCRLRKSKISKSDRFDLAAQMRASVSITVLLGLTWILGIFAIGEASLFFMYLFAAFNSLQGFSVFVFQCLLQAEMRKRWISACCPYCEPDSADSKSGVYSTSRSQTNPTMNKPNNNWRKGTQNTVMSSSYADNPTYEMNEN